ncbi:T9SS type A sorting domain-containing protein [Mongoliibacter ruber]|uniref:Putative secreted protein (Por secretion system target) n=1 Tax=Mongoliibacter ruber TaxID=1750599 RepID=A0A2T0WHS1_9BACT|nr:T9SS type A sorting domain-containing protein [Mongoliibacter ruber]PRY86260.1 putative secreted protein (Por secretion system target) [Mongoliibacter ruber]
MRYLVSVSFLFFSLLSFGQQNFTFDQSIPVSTSEGQVSMPFTPGINAAQFQEMDTNGDGKDELVVWDINSRRILVFAFDGEQFNFLPGMGLYFPSDVNGFLVLADFDGDGRKDLFTSSPFGIKAYKNITPAGSAIPQWEVAQNFLRLDNGSNVTANNLDTPLFIDIDGDGDLDILTFNFASGDYVEFFRNTSMERKGMPDIDGFAFPEARWGGFEFCDCGIFSFGITCSGMPIGMVEEELPQGRIEHAGGHSLLYADFDGDGVKDLLMGQDECNTLYFLPNKGANSNPVFDEFLLELPGFGRLPEFPIFHAAYLWKNNLLVSSLASGTAATFQADYGNNIFKGEGNGFSSFLQDQLLDLGENSRPFFKGFASDGELIMTANSFFNGKVVGKAVRFSVTEDVWTLLDEDYLGLSSFDLLDLQYFEYQNAAGNRYYWLVGTDTVNFALTRKIYISSSADFVEKREVVIPNLQSSPLDQIALFNYEGTDHLLLARQTGELVLYKSRDNFNSLELVERQFLGFSDNPANRNLNIHIVQEGTTSLYAVDQRGVLTYINDFMNQNQRETVQLRGSASLDFLPSRLGRITSISSIPRPFDNSRDLLLGSSGGGLEFLKNELTPQIPGEELLLKVFPNPSSGTFSVLSTQRLDLRVVNTLGQVIAEGLEIPANRSNTFQFPLLNPGVYILDFTTDTGRKITRKLIVRP